jgi:hypothetical protein
MKLSYAGIGLMCGLVLWEGLCVERMFVHTLSCYESLQDAMLYFDLANTNNILKEDLILRRNEAFDEVFAELNLGREWGRRSLIFNSVCGIEKKLGLNCEHCFEYE